MIKLMIKIIKWMMILPFVILAIPVMFIAYMCLCGLSSGLGMKPHRGRIGHI